MLKELARKIRKLSAGKTHKGLVKIIFDVDSVTSPDMATPESLWAKPNFDGTYILDNSPFFVYGVSYQDQVFAREIDRRLVFTGIAKRGGHSTYRVRLPKGQTHDCFMEHWPQFSEMGCTFEGTGGLRRLYSIDIPPSANVTKVYEKLERLEQSGVWEFEEGHVFGADN